MIARGTLDPQYRVVDGQTGRVEVSVTDGTRLTVIPRSWDREDLFVQIYVTITR